MGKCKAKAIQTNLHTFKHNQAYPRIIQAYSKPCVTLTYLGSWYIQSPINHKYIQNLAIFGTQGLFRHLRCQTSTMKRFVKIAENSFAISACHVFYFMK